ncbi:hypothetical protein RUM44_006603 [Polyplax serrata]|uniref:Uncharacterized protein n=1 Tax=Polyplax serrata TaxID=468196 RepID=A0ABR1AK43_POLSC
MEDCGFSGHGYPFPDYQALPVHTTREGVQETEKLKTSFPFQSSRERTEEFLGKNNCCQLQSKGLTAYIKTTGRLRSSCTYKHEEIQLDRKTRRQQQKQQQQQQQYDQQRQPSN